MRIRNLENGLDIIIIDYLQLMLSLTEVNHVSRNLEISLLKALARELKVLSSTFAVVSCG